ncbi:MAG: ABC transporter ATP-binding protein [Terriglobia bacterium]
MRNIWAGYGGDPVLRNVCLEIEAGELVAVLGPSGCGKTTLLKVIAGLLHPSKGDIQLGDQSVTLVPAEKRGAVAVFQKPLLFPHLTVAENVGFGLKMRKTVKADVVRRVAEILRLVQLDGLERKRPAELSGGQEQRVSLARALVTEPRVLLLDEPFTALDVGLRAEMRTLVRSLQRRLHITTIFITHDQEEGGVVADRIALLLNGSIEQFGTPRDLYASPRTARAASFFGWMVLAGERNGASIETPVGDFPVSLSASSSPAPLGCKIAFHPANARLATQHTDSSLITEANLPGKLETIVDLGIRMRYAVRLQSGELLEVEGNPSTEIAPIAEFHIGAKVVVEVPANAVRIFVGSPE